MYCSRLVIPSKKVLTSTGIELGLLRLPVGSANHSAIRPKLSQKSKILYEYGLIDEHRSTHSLSGGLDSPLPPPPVRCCVIQGCVRKKAIMKDGRRPAVCAWQRYWIQLSGPNLLFYQPKYLRG